MQGVTIHNKVGELCPHNGRTIGTLYPSADKSTASDSKCYGYSKQNGQVLFEGWADIDVDVLYSSMSEAQRKLAAVRHTKVELQAKIRSKSTGATVKVNRETHDAMQKLCEYVRQFQAGQIDETEFQELTSQVRVQ